MSIAPMLPRFRYILSALAFAGLLLLQGCEDDPILAPIPGDETGGGSYGVISFPRASAPTANPATF